MSQTESSIAARRRIARAMLDKATSTAPIQSPWQGVANMVNAGFAGWEEGRLDREEREGKAAAEADFGKLGLPGTSPVSSVAQAMAGPEPKPADISKAPANLLPRFAQAEAQYGLPKNFLAQTAKVESSFNPSAKNPNSSATGLFQFTRGTARDYGLTNPLDPIASTDAAARLAADNKATLTRALGREPTAGELYLAHQQGGGGASKLLANPNARAVDVVGRDAVLLNGGREDMTAAEFARRWTSKVAMGGDPDMPAPGAMPAAAETGASGFAVPGQPAPMSGRTFDQITSGAPLDPVFQSEGVSQPWMGTALKPSPAVSQVAAALTGRLPPPRPADLPAPGAVEAVGRMPQPATPMMPDLSNESGAGARELQVMSEQARQGQPQAASNPISAIAAALMGQGAPAPAAAPQAAPAAPQGMPAPTTGPAPAAVAAPTPAAAAPAAAPAGNERSAAALRVLNSPYATEGQRMVAKAIVEQSFRDPAEAEMKRLQLDKARREADAAPLDVESRRLDLDLKRKNLGKADAPTVQRVKQPDGSEVAVQWDQGAGKWVPLEAPQGGNAVKAPGKMTEQQSKDVGFYARGSKIVDRLDTQDTALKETLSAMGGNVSNYLKSDAYRQAEQTGRELLAVILRKDTGAAVTDKEMELYGSIYLPKPGDDDKTVAQKRAARRTAMEGLRMGLGPAEILFNSQNAPTPDSGAPVRVTTPEEARKLPSGTRIILPDGSEGRVP